jgi:hypothetical protein
VRSSIYSIRAVGLGGLRPDIGPGGIAPVVPAPAVSSLRYGLRWSGPAARSSRTRRYRTLREVLRVDGDQRGENERCTVASNEVRTSAVSTGSVRYPLRSGRESVRYSNRCQQAYMGQIVVWISETGAFFSLFVGDIPYRSLSQNCQFPPVR